MIGSVLIKNEKIAFTFNMRFANEHFVKVDPLSLVTPYGIFLPLIANHLSMVELFEGGVPENVKTRFPVVQSISARVPVGPHGILLGMDDRIWEVGIREESAELAYYYTYIPVQAETVYARATSFGPEECLLSAALLEDTIEDAVALFEKCLYTRNNDIRIVSIKDLYKLAHKVLEMRRIPKKTDLPVKS